MWRMKNHTKINSNQNRQKGTKSGKTQRPQKTQKPQKIKNQIKRNKNEKRLGIQKNDRRI